MSKICPVCGNTYSDANAFCPADGTTLRAAEVTADLIGSVVADRYLVTDLLGEGGMGKVYLARHVRLPQQAAIKVLRPSMLKDAAAVARFTREAASASRIDHDRVARVYDFGETSDGTVYLAMEYVPGRSLKKLLTDTGALEPRRAAMLVRQIAEGMDAAHRLGIVHRDLKPDNVMIVEDGDGSERVKVVDFGIAKALGAEEGGAGLTQAGYVVGTPEFMSPEQLLGGNVDARSDVYALAIIAYQCLTGGFPFDTTTPERVMTARLTEAPRTLSWAQPAMAWPQEVQAVLDAGLSRDVEGRPASAGTFARALSTAIEHWRPAAPGMRPLVTPALGAPAVEAPPAPAAASAPSSAPVPPAPAAGGAVSARPSVPAASTPAAAAAGAGGGAAPSGGRRRGGLLAIAGGVLTVGAVAAVLYSQRGGGAEPAASVAGAPPQITDSAAAAPAPNQIAAATPPATPTATPGGTLPAPSTSTPVAPAPSGSAAPAGGAPAAPPVTRPAPPRPAGGASGDAVAARRTFDSVSAALDPERTDEASARAAVPVLRALLPRLTTADDSTWAHIRLLEAQALSGNESGACTSLRAAKRTARSSEQREAVRRYEGTLGC
jgi:serine/threonine-protein kinase